MGLDALCLRAVLRETEELVAGGRIDKIHQPARDEVILSIRGPGGNVRLLLSAAPGAARVHLTALPRENPDAAPMFCMLLRKHLTGARIIALSQPPMERIAILALEARNELGDRTQRKLVLEMMGGGANLLLLDEQERVIDCIRRTEGDLTGKRQLLPGLFYRLPPPHVGIAPLLARELEFRGEADTRAGLSMLSSLIEEGRARPTMLLLEGRPADFSFLPILQYGPAAENRPFPGFGALLDEFYAAREQRRRAGQRGRDLVKAASAARDRVARRLARQRLELERAKDRERLRELGDLVTSNLHEISKGMSRYTAQDYYDPAGGRADIALDPLLTPQQNAAYYYKRYSKAKTAEQMLARQIEEGERELWHLESVLESIPLAEGDKDLAEIRRELSDGGYLRRKKDAGRKEMRGVGAGPMEFRSSAGLRISVGKNNLQNDRLTTKMAGKGDLWLHAQKLHGSHVILWCGAEQPDERSVLEAAALAAWFSQGREGKKVPVDYTPARFVKKPAGAAPGMVVYTTYRTAYADPDEALVKRLRAGEK